MLDERPIALRRPLRRRGLPIGAFVVILVAVAATLASASPRSLARATTDRPDEVVGPQFHVVYAVPADGEDRHLDENGTIEGSVSSFQRWLAGETGGKAFRLDTYQRGLDVTFVRLSKTDAELVARGRYVREGIEEQLKAIGFTASNKIYAVYYDGHHTYSCGDSFRPPELQGTVVALYLHGLPTFQFPCDSNRFATANQAPAYLEYSMVHEFVHALGFVASCAPHHHRAGHVTSPNNDLMWAGDVGSWEFPLKLDVGRDDYYGHGRADCPDLANSPYLTADAFPSQPNPEPPAKPAHPNVVSFSMTKASAGRTFRAILTLDTHVRRAICRATVERQTPKTTRLIRGTYAECSWRLPASARGMRLIGSITATTAGGSATRKFSRRIA